MFEMDATLRRAKTRALLYQCRCLFLFPLYLILQSLLQGTITNEDRHGICPRIFVFPKNKCACARGRPERCPSDAFVHSTSGENLRSNFGSPPPSSLFLVDDRPKAMMKMGGAWGGEHVTGMEKGKIVPFL